MLYALKYFLFFFETKVTFIELKSYTTTVEKEEELEKEEEVVEVVEVVEAA